VITFVECWLLFLISFFLLLLYLASLVRAEVEQGKAKGKGEQHGFV
jgi:hypothetical protein